MGFRARNGSDRMRTIWTPEMDRYFIDLMLEQVVKGNRIDDHLFSKRAWEDMTSLFNEKFKFQYEKDILKNRHKTLRNLYRAIKNLLSQKGFSWDETRQMVRANNKAWDDYIRVHPDARSYRIKTIPYYNDLCEIYKYATTEGNDSLSSQNAKVISSTPGAELGGLLEGPRSPSPSIPWDNGDTSENLDSSSNSGGTTTAIGIHLSNVSEASGGGLHDITIDEDYGISLPQGAADDTPRRTNDTGFTLGIRSRTYWQPPMDRYFIDLMLEQMQKGNQVDGQFRKHAWMEMLESFNTKFGFKYDVDILKNRYKTMKRQYSVIKNLLELDGFAWDNVRQMITADDSIWQDYIKAHTDARQYMTRPVPYYKDLCMICRDLSADVNDGALGYNNLEQHDEVPEMKLSRTIKGLQSPLVSVSSGDQVSSHIGLRNSVADQRNKRPSQDPPIPANSKKARGKDEEGMANALREMATAVSTLTDKRKGNDIANSITVEHVIEAIQALPDMDEDLVLDACDYLEDDKKAKTFLALDVKLRKKWLIRKLRPDGFKD